MDNHRSKKWMVTIPYREPEFALRNPDAPQVYRSSYQITAETGEEALEKAMEEFNRSASMSSVHWRRNPIREQIVVTLLQN